MCAENRSHGRAPASEDYLDHCISILEHVQQAFVARLFGASRVKVNNISYDALFRCWRFLLFFFFFFVFVFFDLSMGFVTASHAHPIRDVKERHVSAFHPQVLVDHVSDKSCSN